MTGKQQVAIVIFASGKIVCTDTRKEKDVYIAVNKLLRKLGEQNVVYGQQR